MDMKVNPIELKRRHRLYDGKVSMLMSRCCVWLMALSLVSIIESAASFVGPVTRGLSPTCCSKSCMSSSKLSLDASKRLLLEVEERKNIEKERYSVVEDESSCRRSFLASNAALLFAVATIAPTEAKASADDKATSEPLHSSTSTVAATSVTAPPVTVNDILSQASQKALKGGKAGASAAVVQVLSLMWLRTSMNYQYRYGGTLPSSLSTLYSQGGIPRLYQGLPFAILQGPLTRFGDTAANVGVLALLDSLGWAVGLPLPLKTACGSLAAGLWRVVLMPVDTAKTVLQVEGRPGLDRLWGEVVGEGGVGVFYRGSLAAAAATAVGHFPWFLTYNYLGDVIPPAESWGVVEMLPAQNAALLVSLARSAVLGVSASCVSDCCSNSLRVIKTTKQTATVDDGKTGAPPADDSGQQAATEISYRRAVEMILEQDGWTGLFGRGLQTRLLTNSIQGAVFSVLWRYFQQLGNA